MTTIEQAYHTANADGKSYNDLFFEVEKLSGKTPPAESAKTVLAFIAEANLDTKLDNLMPGNMSTRIFDGDKAMDALKGELKKVAEGDATHLDPTILARVKAEHRILEALKQEDDTKTGERVFYSNMHAREKYSKLDLILKGCDAIQDSLVERQVETLKKIGKSTHEKAISK